MAHNVFIHNSPTDRASELIEPSKDVESPVQIFKKLGSFGFESFVERRDVRGGHGDVIGPGKEFQMAIYLFFLLK